MLLKGAYCVGEHFVDPHTAPTILRRLFFIFIYLFFLCVRIKTRNSAEIMSYNVPDMI